MDARMDRQRLGFPVLLETSHELAVIKPAGIAVELSRDSKGASLISRVRASCPAGWSPALPHRLDRVSRGIVVIALSKDAVAYHNEQIRQQAWSKIYLARCLAPAGREIESLIGLHKVHLRPRGGRAQVVRSGGRPAWTEVLDAAPAHARDGEIHVLLRLITGRFHQIRATLAYLGAPMVDDWIYGTSPGRGKERFYLEHTALRFVPYGSKPACVLHWADDPDREAIAPRLQDTLDECLAQWENEGAVRRGGTRG
jgi:23S rRNA-/tRNA-specific pseudouridylate synthase